MSPCLKGTLSQTLQEKGAFLPREEAWKELPIPLAWFPPRFQLCFCQKVGQRLDPRP